jgi:hypothetical protein
MESASKPIELAQPLKRQVPTREHFDQITHESILLTPLEQARSQAHA